MTDHIKAARRIWGESAILPLAELERFYAAAYRAGLERAAEICGQIVLDHPGRADLTAMQLERAIRAHAQNQPKNVHDDSVVYKK